MSSKCSNSKFSLEQLPHYTILYPLGSSKLFTILRLNNCPEKIQFTILVNTRNSHVHIFPPQQTGPLLFGVLTIRTSSSCLSWFVLLCCIFTAIISPAILMTYGLSWSSSPQCKNAKQHAVASKIFDNYGFCTKFKFAILICFLTCCL